MLHTLTIRNLAIVEELEVEFSAGLHVFSGETGAGKSLVLGALRLVLGDRADKSVIRHGAEQCEVGAVFRLNAAAVAVRRAIAALLDGAGVAGGDDELLVRRVIGAGGSRAYVNQAPVTAQFLRQLGDLIMEIHGPHDAQLLLQAGHQLLLLDSFGRLGAALDEIAAAWKALAATRRELEEARSAHASPERLELLRLQLAEIEAAGVEAKEEEELLPRFERAANAGELVRLAAAAQNGLVNSDGCIADQLSPLVRLLQQIQGLDSGRGSGFATTLERVVDDINELARDLETYADGLDLDPEELARLEARMNLLQKLKRKYGPGLDQVLQTAENMRAELEGAGNREARLATLGKRCAELEAAHLECCRKLSLERQQKAAALGLAIEKKLKHLGFAQSAFAVKLIPATPGPGGADSAEYHFAPNPGEPMRPLRDIASSGEIARVMLAIKTVLGAVDAVPILVFDEVDANVGGRVASLVAKELAKISAHHQVLCISHLPQIAANGKHHYLVSKQTRNGRTLARLQLLDRQGREVELTRMLGASEDSAAARAHAREMLAGTD